MVTDSTASLPPALAEGADVVTIPLQVTIDGATFREGVDLGPARLVAALRSGARVTTSQPAPEAFARAYARLAARGAREIVSVHLSGDLSGTVTSARTATQMAGVPVHVVDSRTVAMGLGFGVLAGVRAARSGASGSDVARAAAGCSSGATVLFALESLEHLRRGGRLGPLAAALGAVLGLRPVLGVVGGRLEVVEKVRTSARARTRMAEAVAADLVRRRSPVVAVHHLGQPELADELAEKITELAGGRAGEIVVAEVSAVLGAHTGPGVLAAVVADG